MNKEDIKILILLVEAKGYCFGNPILENLECHNCPLSSSKCSSKNAYQKAKRWLKNISDEDYLEASLLILNDEG
ncbi:MAG TPA: hypothetical protein P5136_01515 [Methanofastidiosum sp.]|nr:hypothetical protein [Methanofastidiosum sp.]